LCFSSGASLINNNLLWRVEQQRKAELKIVEDIKKKMDRIRERHIKERSKRSREMDEPDHQLTDTDQHVYLEYTDHYEGTTFSPLLPDHTQFPSVEMVSQTLEPILNFVAHRFLCIISFFISSYLSCAYLLFAAEHFRLLALRCGTACHQRLRRHRLWRPSALDSRRSCH